MKFILVCGALLVSVSLVGKPLYKNTLQDLPDIPDHTSEYVVTDPAPATVTTPDIVVHPVDCVADWNLILVNPWKNFPTIFP